MLLKAAGALQGVCKLGGFTIFCSRALPGEVLRARITAVKKSHALVRPTCIPSCPLSWLHP